MSSSPQENIDNEPPAEMTSWALAMLARATSAEVIDPPEHHRLTHLCEVFSLGDEGRRLVALLYGLWRGAGTNPPVSAVQAREVVGVSNASLRGILLGWELAYEAAVTPGAALALALDETIGDWLDGGDPVPPQWRDRIGSRAPIEPLSTWPVAELATFAGEGMNNGDGSPIVVELIGATGSGRRSLAATVCHELGTEGLFVDFVGLGDADALHLHLLAERTSRLTLRSPVYSGLDMLHVPAERPLFPLQFEIRETRKTTDAIPARARKSVLLGPLPLEARREGWRRLLPSSAKWDAEEFEALLRSKPFTIGEIAQVAAQQPNSAREAMAAIRADQLARLTPVILPRSGSLDWDDLVVPQQVDKMLRRFADEIALAPTMWEEAEVERLFGHGRGVFALFSGDSGTGKTMAAQIVAASLDVDLYVVDSGAIMSKYVGETAQNMQQVLRQAENDAALLFFDEADGIFGKRTENRDAHARYLNADTNVLLQAVEEYSGGCILATNKRENIDPAFVRRLRYAVDFPRPDGELREAMWSKLASQLCDNGDDLKDTCRSLAQSLDFTGAQIKQAMRTALIEAKRDGRTELVSQDLLLGAEHELSKEGRALSAAEARRLGMQYG